MYPRAIQTLTIYIRVAEPPKVPHFNFTPSMLVRKSAKSKDGPPRPFVREEANGDNDDDDDEESWYDAKLVEIPQPKKGMTVKDFVETVKMAFLREGLWVFTNHIRD